MLMDQVPPAGEPPTSGSFAAAPPATRQSSSAWSMSPDGKPLSLRDNHGRTFEYLRLSLTDVCNFRCSYCLPDGYRKAKGAPANLDLEELRRLVTGFAQLGVWKIRLTGGEPTLRREFAQIASMLSGIDGIRRLAVTTNGYRLTERAGEYAAAGIRAINISIDSLKPEAFQAITGHDRLSDILKGIDACRNAGIESIKINTVLLKDLNALEIDDFIAFVQQRDLALRFIELMRTNDNAEYFKDRHVAASVVYERLEALGWQLVPPAPGAGPAKEFCHPQSLGRIGVIAPYSKDFCAGCNRLRVSATGKLHLCLFGDMTADLRPLLQADDQIDALVARIVSLLGGKTAGHRLHQGNSGATSNLAMIGG